MTAEVIHLKDYDLMDASLPRIAWAPESTDLHVNLVMLYPGESIGKHVNETLDVLLTCLAGEGEAQVDGDVIPSHPAPSRSSLSARTAALSPATTGFATQPATASVVGSCQ